VGFCLVQKQNSSLKSTGWIDRGRFFGSFTGFTPNTFNRRIAVTGIAPPDRFTPGSPSTAHRSAAH